jgi:nucleotide-binding universal stress UspA family protein
MRVEKPKPSEVTISVEARKGYGLLLIGREPASKGDTFHEQITRSAVDFAGAFAVVIARGEHRRGKIDAPLKILVPVSGTAVSRHGAELAIALAQASQGSVTALHIAGRTRERRRWQHRFGAALAPDSSADAITREIVQLGSAYGVEVKAAVRKRGDAENVILRELKRGQFNLLVMGVSPRPAEQLSFGEVAAELLKRAECSLVFLASDPANFAQSTH